MPKREMPYFEAATKQFFYCKKIQKQVQTYELGNHHKKVLLVHGWSGRGTQLAKIGWTLESIGFTVISFDAPAHGFSKGKTTNLIEFVAIIEELSTFYEGFDYVIGHSLGGMAVLNAISKIQLPQKAVIIGSGNSVDAILNDFVAQLQLPQQYVHKMKNAIEKKYQQDVSQYSAYKVAQLVPIPVMVIHDEDDADVALKEALHIHENLPNGTLHITKKLGHRKILGDKYVIEKIVDFINQ